MIRKHVTTALLCALPMLAAAQAAQLSPVEAGLKFMTAFRDCQARHDVATCGALVDPDAKFFGDNGRRSSAQEFLHDVAEPKAIPRTMTEPEDVLGWRNGDLLFFNYISVWTEMYGAQPYRMQYRATMVLRESPAGPRLQMFQATLIPNNLRRPAKIDPSVYDQYVGEYSAGPGDHELITRQGSRLLMTLNGGQVELLPIDPGTFYIQGEADDWLFIRDAQGKVTGLESRLWGQNVLAPRL